MEENQIRPRLIDPQKRVILPAEVLDALNLEAGDYVGFEVSDGEVRLRKVEWVMK